MRHTRRDLLRTLAGLAACGPAAGREGAFVQALRTGGCAVLIRHALTEPGIGDPPGFSLAVCSSQRQLSPAGREQARSIGRWFGQQGLRPERVFSSLWCRCKDTADLAFGAHQVWPALNSTFGQASLQPAQTRQVRERLASMQPGRFEVWLTHQVNMTDLTSDYPAMGEAFVVSSDGRLLARWAWS
jgi:broad specificity phosphatase PhoE